VVVIILLCDSICALPGAVAPVYTAFTLDPGLNVVFWLLKGVDAMSAIYLEVLFLLAIFIMIVVLVLLYLGNCLAVVYVCMIFAVSSVLSDSVYVYFGRFSRIANVQLPTKGGNARFLRLHSF
jgi:hypothetical protein